MTPPVTTEALVESLTTFIMEHSDYVVREQAAWRAEELVKGPLAPLLAAHQQVTAERDEARAELARLRAEGEAKDRRIAALTEAPQVVILQLGEEERRIAGEAARAFRAFLSDPRTLGACSVEHYGFSRPDGGVRITTWSNLPGVSFVNGRFRHSSLPGREYAREEIEAAMIPDLEEIARAATAREG